MAFVLIICLYGKTEEYQMGCIWCGFNTDSPKLILEIRF